VTGDPIVDALRAAIQTATAPVVDGGSPRSRLVAIGWATVELERAIAELARALGTEPGAFRRAGGSVSLGSSCHVGAALLEGGIDLAVVEPSTEGRLAAHLARHGEGPTIAWFADLRSPGDTTAARDAGVDGPFGPERVLPAYADGLLRLLVAAPPGTIAP
jgi:peptidoglycan/xylan/chitin deacetylase (PgdA/CDA1 family)